MTLHSKEVSFSNYIESGESKIESNKISALDMDLRFPILFNMYLDVNNVTPSDVTSLMLPYRLTYMYSLNNYSFYSASSQSGVFYLGNATKQPDTLSIFSNFVLPTSRISPSDLPKIQTIYFRILLKTDDFGSYFRFSPNSYYAENNLIYYVPKGRQ